MGASFLVRNVQINELYSIPGSGFVVLEPEPLVMRIALLSPFCCPCALSVLLDIVSSLVHMFDLTSLRFILPVPKTFRNERKSVSLFSDAELRDCNAISN